MSIQKQIIDVRDPEKFAKDHIEGAINVSHVEIVAGNLPGISKDKPVLLYCGTGNKAARMAKEFRKAGFTDVESTSLGELRKERVPGWVEHDNQLSREFKFEDFTQALDFMVACGAVAEQLNHHPDWSNSYNVVNVTLTTHDRGKVTDRDVKLAKEMNRIYGR